MDAKLGNTNNGISYVEDVELNSINSVNSTDKRARILSTLQEEAEAGTRAEKELGVRDALRKWPKAVLWAVVFGSAIVMEGYDIALIGAFWGFPSFQEKYGQPYIIKSGRQAGEVGYQVSPAWQSGTSSGSWALQMIGVLLGGTLCHRHGYRPVFVGALLIMMVIIFGTFYAQNMAQLCAAELLLGLPWGVFSSLGPAYASEVAPVALRAYLTTYMNLCWLVGQLVATGVLKALLSRDDEWGYRIPFALQWAWPLPILVAVLLSPESPWHLVRVGQLDEAKRALRRTCREDRGVNVDHHLSMMIHTNELERKLCEGTSYLECFRGTDLRRTEISCMAWGCQQLCGSPFGGQAIYFFTVAGLSTSVSYSLGVGTYALGFLGTISSWFLMTWFGRRSIYLVGSVIMVLLMLGIGIAAIPAARHAARGNGTGRGDGGTNFALYAQAGLMLAFVAVYDASIGPVAYALVSEISATRLRAKTVGLSRCFYNIIGIVALTAQPYLINPTAANLQGKVGFVWAGIGVLSTVWIYFRLPEPKGRTFEELDLMFQRKLPAREFAKHTVERLQL